MSNAIKKKVLVVDDEDGIRQLVSDFLTKFHFQVIQAANGAEFREAFKNCIPDLILLDLMLPDAHGLDLCKEVRKSSDVPIIMLTAAQGEMNTVLGFEAGADDYIEKPFSAHVLHARIQALIKRTQNTKAAHTLVASAKPGEVNFNEASFSQWTFFPHESCIRHVTGRNVFLTKNECTLLELFIIHEKSILTRDQIGEALHLDTDDVESRAIDVQVSRLRNKLKDKSNNNLIKSVRNKGYLLAVPARVRITN